MQHKLDYYFRTVTHTTPLLMSNYAYICVQYSKEESCQ